MNNLSSKTIVTSWGHPSVSYGGDDFRLLPKIVFAPSKFDEFRDIMDLKNGDRGTGMIHYQDEDGDWVPIESQLEYEEAIMCLRRVKRAVPLRLIFPLEDRTGRLQRTKTPSNACKLRAKEVERQLRKLQKEGGKSSGEKSGRSAEKSGRHCSTTACTGKESSHSKNAEKLKLKSTSAPPAWFEKYMQKFKSDLLSEVAMMLEQKGLTPTTPTIQPETAEVATGAETQTADVSTSTGKHLTVDITSVLEPLAYMDQKSSKLMKKMSKAHNSERKLKKLNSKLEQLELKRARLLEWNRKRMEVPIPLPNSNLGGMVSPAPSSSGPVMDAAVLSGGNTVIDKMYVAHDSRFIKTWRVLNNGNCAWNDKTELRLAHVTPGLKPLESIVACPHLEPGQEGDIIINFQAPDFAGVFESYWHFYHDDVRFGQWMGCSVVVDPKPSESSDEACKLLRNNDLQKSIKEVQLQFETPSEASVSGTAAAVSAATETEDRGEYESDPDDNNNVSHSDNDVQSSSDSEDSEDSESFVHVPLPQCYQFHDMPLFNIPPECQEDNNTEAKEPNSIKSSNKPNTPPSTPREMESEEELFEEASATHSEPPVTEPASQASLEQASASQDQTNSPPVRILPETFVTGAINVATRALSATEAIMKTFHGSSFNIPAQPETSTSGSQPITPLTPGREAIPLPPPPSAMPNFALNSSPYMQMLQDMGFNNLTLNAALLTQHSNNLSQVVAELLSMSQSN